MKLTPNQRAILSNMFEKNPYPGHPNKEELANSVDGEMFIGFVLL